MPEPNLFHPIGVDRMRRAIVVVISGIALLIGGAVFTRFGVRAQSPGSPPKAETVHGLARLLPATGLIGVGVRPGVRVVSIPVKAGDTVKAGDRLAVLEGRAQAEAQLALAVAKKAQATEQRARRREAGAVQRKREDRVQKARLDQLTAASKTLKERVEAVGKAFDTFQATLTPKDRFEDQIKIDQLRGESAKTDFELEQVRADQDALTASRSLEDRELADGGPADVVIDRQVDLARAALADTEVIAPSSGTILDVSTHPGEVGSGLLLYLGDLSAMVAEAEVDQADVGRVAAGDAARVTVLGREVTGKVIRVGALIAPNQMAGVDPRAPRDLRVVKITVALDDPAAASRYVNMQADVTVTPRPAR